MSEGVAQVLVIGVSTYLGLGILFGVPCVTRWLGRLDPVAKSGTWGFRFLVFPGVVTLWPLLLIRLLRKSPPPTEKNAHRQAAQRGVAG